jgi:hypothetical protein
MRNSWGKYDADSMRELAKQLRDHEIILIIVLVVSEFSIYLKN